MDLGSIFLILALAVLVSLFISRPLLTRQGEDIPLVTRQATVQADHERSALLAEQERILNALQELDFDQALGKIPPEDYPAQRAAYLQAGVAILQRLDALQSAPGEKQVSASDAARQLEEAVAVRRADSQAARVPVVAAASEDSLENLIAARRRARQERFGGFCPKCGRPVQKSDKFCSHCGAPIA